MRYEDDIFISYAHIDNPGMTPEQKGWIIVFICRWRRSEHAAGRHGPVFGETINCKGTMSLQTKSSNISSAPLYSFRAGLPVISIPNGATGSIRILQECGTERRIVVDNKAESSNVLKAC